MSTSQAAVSTSSSDHPVCHKLGHPRWRRWLALSAARRPEVILAAIIAFALVLRLPNFIHRDAWADEIIQYEISSASSLPELFARLRARDRNPPGYALLCHAALRIADTDAMLRLPALAGGLGCVIMAWYVGKSWFGLRGAVLMSALCAICPSYVFYSGEARPYSLGLCAIFWFLLCLNLFRRRPTTCHATLLSMSAMAAMTLQYANIVLVAVVLAATAAISLRAASTAPRIVIARCAAIAVMTGAAAAMNTVAFMCPQVEALGAGRSDFPRYFFNLASLQSAAAFLATNLPGFLAHATFSEYPDYLSRAWRPICLVGFLPLLAAAVIGGCRRKGQVRCVASISLAALAAFVLLAGVGAHPFGAIRHTLPLTPLLFLLCVSGVLVIERRRLLFRLGGRLAFSLLVLQMGVALVENVPDFMSFDYRKLKAHIDEKRRPNEWVVVTGPLSCIGLKHLSKAKQWLQPPWCYVSESPRAPVQLTAIRTMLPSIFNNDAPSIWFVEDLDLGPPTDLGELGAVCDETCVMRGVRASHWKQDESK